MRFSFSIITTLLLVLFSNLLFGQRKKQELPDYLNTNLSFEKRTKDLIDRMTLEEKISQVGNSSAAIPRLGIQEYNWWNECLHGVARAGKATVFPQAIAMSASFDTSLMYEVATAISTEARAKHHEFVRNKNYSQNTGLTHWSPNINIFRDPRWGRGHETYGEDPYLTGQMGIQFVKGLQGDNGKYLKVVATPKHYAVHNGPEPERHTFNAVPNTRDLWETYLPAFEDLIVKAKAYSIMGAYNRVDGESASASSLLLDDILRNQWGFEGFVVSDCGAIKDIYAEHKIVNTPEEAAAVGIRKGCDLNCGNIYQNHLEKALADGLISTGEIDIALYRLIMARMKLGMFDPSEMVPYAQIPYHKNDSEVHDKLALTMAEKSMTLLKNNGILPLNKNSIKEIAVIGPNATSLDALHANYHGDASNPVTVLEGIKNALGQNTIITYDQACPLVSDKIESELYKVIATQYLSTVNQNNETLPGLTAQYFNGVELAGDPIFERIEKIVRHDWKNGSPTDTEIAQGLITEESRVPNEKFSARWTGQLLAPESGLFKIGMVSDDGCRVFINGENILDAWHGHAMEAHMGEITLVKGQSYDITIEYFEDGGGAGAYLIWQLPSQKNKKKSEGPFKVSEEVISQVKRADVAIFVGGLDASWEGEEMPNRTGIEGFYRGDRTKIELPSIQLKTIRTLQKTGTPIILVLMSGGAMAFEGLEDDISAILLGWYPGQRGGDAVANTLFGNHNPAGRLPITFYESTKDLADF